MGAAQRKRHRVPAAAATLAGLGDDVLGRGRLVAGGAVARVVEQRPAAPAIGFALLPDIVDAGDATDGIALVAAVTSLTAFAGVLVQPLARRLGGEGGTNLAAVAGLLAMTAALGAAALTAASGEIWLLLPDAVLFGSAYGLCLVAGLLEVGQLAPAGELGAVTAAFYALTYLGFGAPYLIALAHGALSYPALLLIAAALALATAALVSRPPAPR